MVLFFYINIIREEQMSCLIASEARKTLYTLIDEVAINHVSISVEN